MSKLIGSVNKPQQAKGIEGQVLEGPKHISQLDPTARARADEKIRESLLAIVLQQGKPVTIPIEVLDAAAASHRLVIEVSGGVVTLSTEKAPSVFQG